jgi:hypothetical protein
MTSATQQLDLLPKDDWEHLFPYWRDSLKSDINDAFYFRHARNTTGWSSCRGGISFARFLFRHGQMTKNEFCRYWKFFRRVERWESWDYKAKPGGSR